MSKTKDIIHEILENRCLKLWFSMPRSERVRNLISDFGCSRNVAYRVSDYISTYSEYTLFNLFG